MPAPLVESAVFQHMQQYKDALAAHDSDTLKRLADRYVKLQDSLEARIVATAEQAAALSAKTGEPISVGALYRIHRYQQLSAQMASEWTSLCRDAYGITVDAASAAAQAGYVAGQTALGVLADMTTLPAAAIAIQEGMTAGGPLHDLLLDAYPDVESAVADKLVEGVALGRGPDAIANEMSDALGIGLTRISCIARTETYGAFRAADQQAMTENGVTEYMRLSARDDDVCAGCMVEDGETYDAEQDFDDHPNCRCVCVPIVPGVAAEEFQSSEDWFAEQPPEVQQGIVGVGALDLYQNGDVSWGQLASRTEDPTWGGAIVPTSLSELQAGGGGVTPGEVTPSAE